jgi:Tol biopolymer transport system component
LRVLIPLLCGVLVVFCGGDEPKVPVSRVSYVCSSTPEGVCVVDTDGKEEKRIDAPPGFTVGLAWSLDGSRIAIDSSGQIWAMNADGSNQVRLTSKPSARPAEMPAWSPDGTRIAFASGLALWMINADGTEEKMLAPSIRGGTAISWSPDGETIAFNCDTTGCLIRADGSGPVRLLEITIDGFQSPVWSPDGQRLAVGSGAEIVVIQPDGSARQVLTDQLEPPAGDPVWSPDGRQIAFVGNALDIYVVNADGSAMKRLRKGGIAGIYTDPSWSPDGGLILFNCQERTAFNICVMRSDGSGKKGLARGESPVWIPSPK